LPLVGYGSPYPASLIQENGGGILTEPNTPDALAVTLSRLASNRTNLLLSLSEKAVQDGATFTDAKVFAHRAELMKRMAA
jgi:colanic acid/amylovoran biosynthesis glycosyltransferase